MCRTLLGAILTTATSNAAIFVAPKSEFGAPLVRFDEIPLNSALSGQTLNGFTFSENIPIAITTVSGPGISNSLTVPWAANPRPMNPATYVLTIQMPAVETRFGFGFAINNTTATPNALTLTLFDGSTNLGSLTYGGAPDPVFNGGFAGIGSTIGFTSAQITFNNVSFAIDNLVIPEPARFSPPR